MRAGAGDALQGVFSDIAELAANCRFADCRHTTEPDCAVRQAIEAGELDAGRLRRFQKLRSEDRRARESLAERRTRDRVFGRMIKAVQAEQRHHKGSED